MVALLMFVFVICVIGGFGTMAYLIAELKREQTNAIVPI